MFAKKHRFSFKNGAPKNFFQTPFFVIKYDSNSTNGLECAVVVGKKVDKRAVVRNKIKRKIVLAIKENTNDKVSFRIIVYLKKSVKEDKIEEAIKDLLISLNKLK